MTTAIKRIILEAINTCVKGDLFTEGEALLILSICNGAIDRAISEAEEEARCGEQRT